MHYLILVLFLPTLLFAQWNEASLKLLESKQNYIKYTKPAFITYWGGVKRYLKGAGLEGDEFQYQDPSLTSEVDLYLYKKASSKKLPLVVFFPGIHGNHEGRISPVVLNWFERKDFHVGSVPNFLNVNYIKAKPKYDKENSGKLDSQVALRAVDAMVKEIGKENISHITFVGESLGAFLSASMVRFINDHPYLKANVKNVIFMWPPLNIGKTLTNFDRNINNTKDVYAQCNFAQDLFRFFKYLVWQETPSDFNAEDEVCLDAALYHAAFLKSIRKAFKAYADTFEDDKTPEPNNFSEFFQAYNPNFIKVARTQGQALSLKNFIAGWKSYDISVKVVSSTDDFLNNLADWKEIEDKFLFNWGSHCAPLALDEWGEILVKESL
tara:strand:+ start:27916 stop:29058 length:1143 start_codon:yes stop_codon:yes gene_type:complete